MLLEMEALARQKRILEPHGKNFAPLSGAPGALIDEQRRDNKGGTDGTFT